MIQLSVFNNGESEFILSCEEKGTWYPESLDDCKTKRMERAMKSHMFILVPREGQSDIRIRCPVCKDDVLDVFSWVWVPRASDEVIFDYSTEPIYQDPWTVKEHLFRFVESAEDKESKTTDPCLISSTNELKFFHFIPSKHAGTYMCRNENDSTHAANYIYTHVDTVWSSDSLNDEVKLPAISKMNTIVENLEEIRTPLQEIKEDLARAEDLQTEVYGPLILAYKFQDNLPATSLCGPIRVKLERTCFVRINPEIQSQMFHKDVEEKFIYNMVRLAFDALTSWRFVVMPTEIQAKLRLARLQANELGFPLFENDTDMYIPCRFSLFQQMSNLGGKFTPLKKRGIYVNVNFHIKCQELDPMELISMSLERDIGKMKSTLLGVDDTRYMKLETVIMEGSEVIRLSCRLSRPVDCNTNMHPILWRAETGHSFARRTALDERIYMSGSCELVIRQVDLNDSGIYKCFIRDPQNPAKWHRAPKLAYRVKVEKKNYKLPDKNDVLIGIIVLTGWSICIFVMWVILLIFNQQVYSTALIVAKARRNRKNETAEVEMDFPIDTESPI